VHVGLHDHSEQGPIDATPPFEDAREEAAGAKFRDLQVHIAGFGRQQSVSSAVALRGPSAGPFEAIGADLGRRLGVDESLEHERHALANQVDVPAGANRVEQFVQVSIGNGHWVVLLG
jgi:hypothetical protein